MKGYRGCIYLLLTAALGMFPAAVSAEPEKQAPILATAPAGSVGVSRLPETQQGAPSSKEQGAPSELKAELTAIRRDVIQTKAEVKEVKSAVAKLVDAQEKEKDRLKAELLNRQRVPFNGVLLRFSEKEQVAKMTVNNTFGGGEFAMGGFVQAPLNEETRQAPFLNDEGRPLPLRAGLNASFNALQKLARGIAMGKTAIRIADVGKTCAAFRAAHSSHAKEQCFTCKRSSRFYTWVTNNGSLEQRALVVSTCNSYDENKPESAEARSVPWFIDYAIGIEIEVGLDRQSVYTVNLDKPTTSKGATSLDVRGTGVWFASPWLAVPLKLGYNGTNSFKTAKTERCTTRAASDENVSGRSCENVLFLTDDPSWRSSFSGETGLVVALPIAGVEGIGVGADVRVKVRNVGNGGVLTLSPTVFVTPTQKPVLTRFGVGWDTNFAFEDAPGSNPDYRAGDDWSYPFLLVGGSL